MVLFLFEKRSLPNFELWLVDRVSGGAGGRRSKYTYTLRCPGAVGGRRSKYTLMLCCPGGGGRSHNSKFGSDLLSKSDKTICFFTSISD